MPLTLAVLHILLALAETERHGFKIMKQVENDSGGNVNMGPGTLYGSICRMIDTGLKCESNKRVDPDKDDQRRGYYEMTALGHRALEAELQRCRELVALAGRTDLSPGAFAYGH